MHSLNVLHCDNHQLVVNKPAGILTQPSGTNSENLEALAKEWVRQHYNKPGQVFLHAIHRLDKAASGIVLFARTSKALSRLQEQMRAGKYRKTYQVLTAWKPKASSGTLEDYLVHDEHYARVATQDDDGAKLARLHYRVLESYEGYVRLEVTLETGRYHQIRAQLAPILGDSKYGSHIAFAPDAIALHHLQLEFPHPINREMQVFSAPLPPIWLKFM